jgi:alpha-glucosidase
MIDRYEGALPDGAWPNWVLGTHDRSRVATRVGRPQARVAAMLLLTLRGTPTLYQGDEIGIEDVPIPVDRIRDPQGINIGPQAGRDPERTPMQWDDGPNAGFTTAPEPWLPVATDYKQHNVARERADPHSMLALHRRLIDLRQSKDALTVGAYRSVPAEGHLLAFTREHGGARFLVALNLGHEPATLPLADDLRGRLKLSTHLDREGDEIAGAIELRADEGVVVRVA